MADSLKERAVHLVVHEGWLLDRRQWDEWLGLYREDAVYWLPCFKDEHQLTEDPEKELSLVYYGSRAGLEDRVFRLRTERSLASTPLPRTCHMVSVVDCMVENDGSVRVESNWTTHSYKFEKATSFFGTQTHILREDDDGELRITWREVIVMNDMIPSVLDIYSV